MIKKRAIEKKFVFFLFAILLTGFASATYTNSNPQLSQYGVQNSASSGTCKSGVDFLVQIAPLGCTPAVIRSDLLEEQNVPIFCQLAATQINPLIDVKAIDSITFKGNYPKEVSGIGFHPAKAALGVDSQLNSPAFNNIGYVVITLKQQQNESSMPDFVYGNLTANLKYDLKTTLGIGTAGFYLPELSEDDWQARFNQFGFWNGRGYLRADNIGNDDARISIYDKNLKRLSSVDLKEGESSGKLTFPGFDCLAGFTLKLTSLDNPGTRARLRINADVSETARGERFLDNKCSARSMEKKGIIQRVEISCKEDSNGFYKGKPFTLEIIPNIKLGLNNQAREAGLGDYLYDSAGKSVYLAYIGTDKDSTKKEDLFVYLLSLPNRKDKLSDDELRSVSNLVNKLTYSQKGSILESGEEALQKLLGFGIVVGKFFQGQEMYRINYNKPATIFRKQVLVMDYVAPKDMEITDEKILDNLKSAVENYNEISQSFSQEKYPSDSQETLGEDALYNHLQILHDLGQKRTMVDLCTEFKEKYPDSTKNLDICNDAYRLSNEEASTAYVLINGKTVQISFDGIYEPSIEEYSAEILVKGPNGETKPYILTKDEVQALEGFRSPDLGETVQLVSLDDDSATLRLNIAEKGVIKIIPTADKKLTKGSSDNFGSAYTFTLTKVNLKRTARVSLVPSISATGSQADFQFKVGIEKRWNMTLTPEKVKETIKNLNSTINKIENLTVGLGKVVEAGKTACLATGGVLIVSNFLQAFEGKAIARQTVMRGVGGWYEKCAGQNLDKCLLDNAQKIDADVGNLTKLMNEQNTQIKNIEKNFIKTGLLQETSLDEEGFLTLYSQKVGQEITGLGTTFSDPSGKGDDINMNDVKTILTPEHTNAESLRNIELYNNVLNSDASTELKTIAKKNLYSELLNLQVAYGDTIAATTMAQQLGINAEDITLFQNEKTKILSYSGLTNGDINTRILEVGADNPVQLIEYNGQVYMAALDNSIGKGVLPIKKDSQGFMIYDSRGLRVSESALQDSGLDLKSTYFKKFDTSSYQNKYKNPEARFYETQPYQGMPSIIPFDINNGWYAATKPTLPVLGNIKSFDESGRVTSYWLCNVGSNGIEEFNTMGDDTCEQINLGNGQPYNLFPGLDATEAQKRITAGVNAIQSAATQYNSGSKKITVNVGYGSVSSDVGRPAADIPAIQCQDFMSPNDCQILFNVCDPFICPSSRCDMGGAYPVKDVIQSGIIGSIALCLPNFKEGILLPVCVSGIYAGLEGFLSVEKSYRDCLQNSLDTGQVVGICDEVHSLYLCDFFWKQALPLAKVAIPNLISSALGGVRGGGEYLGVNSAFDNAKKSADYFVQYYGSSSGKAFQFRTAEEFIGDAVCKTYSSAVYPNGADLLSSLTKASSPSQFTGRFDEIPFTTVTVPPTSQYKVFYHIFAGNDAGAYYQVYLKGSSESFYQDASATYVVASGYAPVGEYASETKDFTAPSGYKQLCINVNGQEECGFQEVSTSFAVDYITESYAGSQAKQADIKTESECASDSNLGIIRICSTGNPGEGTDPYIGTESQRWIEVGYCDNTKVKCWLDKQSVKDNIKIGTIKNDTLSNIDKNYLDALSKEGNILNDGQFNSVVEKLQGETSPDSRITIVDNSVDKTFYNNRRAYLLLWRGDAYAELARKLLGDFLNSLTTKPTTTSAQPAATAKKTYLIDKVGFQKNNGAAIFETDVEKNANDAISIAILPENNCDEEKYQIFSPRILRVILGGNTKSGIIEKTAADNLLNTLDAGTYYVQAYCYNSSKVNSEATSKNLIVRNASSSGTTTGKNSSGILTAMNYAKTTKVVNRNCNCGDNCQKYADSIISAANTYKEDAWLLLSIMMQESDCTVNAKSGSSVGLMQISSYLDCKGIGVNSLNDVTGIANYDKNIQCGSLILRQKYNTFGPKMNTYTCDGFTATYTGWDAALRGYLGYGCTNNSNIDVTSYVSDVNKRYNLLKDIAK